MKASAAKGSFSSQLRTTSAPVRGSVPVTGGTSSGLGRKSSTASSMGWMPLFLRADPHRTGMIRAASVPARIALTIRSGATGSPSRKLWAISSSRSARDSIRRSCQVAASADSSDGISPTSIWSPRSLP